MGIGPLILVSQRSWIVSVAIYDSLMRIRQITVKNFRAIRHVSLKPAACTVLVGENATGKTSILHALRLLLDTDARRLVAELTEDDLNHEARKAGERTLSIEIEVGEVERHPELQAAFMTSVATDGTEQYFTLRGSFGPEEPTDKASPVVWRALVLPPDASKADPVPFTARMAQMLPLYHLDAVRDAARETRASGRSLLGRLLQDISLDDIADKLRTAVVNVNTQLGASKALTAMASALTNLIRPHTPGSHGDLRFVLTQEDIDSVLKGLRLVVHEPGGSLDIARQATGLQNLVLVALFRHLVTLTGVGFPILSFEEPEGHLHPHGQRRLAQELVALPGPTLMTTHSPIVVEKVPLASVIRLARGTSGVSSYQCAAPSRQEQTDFAQFIRAGRAEALFARSVIAVEGESECIALPAFARLLGLDLDRDGVYVVRCESNTFVATVQRALGAKALHIPVVVTYDLDALERNDDLLNTAIKGGALEATVSAAKGQPVHIKRAALDALGWIAVTENFEEEVCSNGYGDVAVGVIDAEGFGGGFDKFVSTNGLSRDGTAAGKYIPKHSRLKISLARAVASNAATVRRVPSCFEVALTRAVALATA